MQFVTGSIGELARLLLWVITFSATGLHIVYVCLLCMQSMPQVLLPAWQVQFSWALPVVDTLTEGQVRDCTDTL